MPSCSYVVRCTTQTDSARLSYLLRQDATHYDEDVRVQPRVTPLKFVVWFGFVSALGDFVYEGARSVIGPFLAHLGASAAVVGIVTGIGEAVALVFRLGTGRLADRTGKPWPQTIAGYALTMLCVPLLAVSGGLSSAALLYNGERFGK